MLVSIITATYNSAKTLRDTMDSVLGQTYPDIEYIVIDGGSTDGTIEIIKEYASKMGSRMQWVCEPDNGIYDAMNKGLKRATGEVVGFLNSDDYFTHKDVIERIVPYFRQDGTDAVYGDIHFIRENAPAKCARYYSSAIFRPWLLRFGIMPAHPSFYARKNVYERAGDYHTDYRIGADYEMMVRLFIKERIRARYLKMDFVTMRLGGLSTKNVRSRLTLIDDDVKGCRDNGLYTNRAFICLKYLYKVFEFRF